MSKEMRAWLHKIWRRIRGIPDPSPTRIAEIIDATIYARSHVMADTIVRHNAFLDRLSKGAAGDNNAST